MSRWLVEGLRFRVGVRMWRVQLLPVPFEVKPGTLGLCVRHAFPPAMPSLMDRIQTTDRNVQRARPEVQRARYACRLRRTVEVCTRVELVGNARMERDN